MFSASLCFVLLCVFGSPAENKVNPPPVTLVLAQDTYSKNEFTERLILVEQYRTFGGFVVTPDNNGLDVVAGYFPLQMRAGSRIRVDGGVSLATKPLPHRGTRANWVARAVVKVAGPLNLEWWHFSNSGADRPNPSLDALAVSFSW
jgi:hypothetical protein